MGNHSFIFSGVSHEGRVHYLIPLVYEWMMDLNRLIYGSLGFYSFGLYAATSNMCMPRIPSPLIYRVFT